MWFFGKRKLSEYGQLVADLLEKDGWSYRPDIYRSKILCNSKLDIKIQLTCSWIYLIKNGVGGYNFSAFTSYDKKKLSKIIKQKIKFFIAKSIEEEKQFVKKDLKNKLCNNS